MYKMADPQNIHRGGDRIVDMRSILLLLAAAACAFAQQPNTVTASVSHQQQITTSTAVFQIQLVDASLNSTVDSAAGVLASVGVNSSHLTDVSVAISQGYLLTTYNFTLPVASGDFAATRDKLLTVQRNLSNSQTQGLGWSSSQIPTDDELASALELAMPALLEKAKRKASLLATAMHANLGDIVTLSAPAVAPTGATVTVTISATYAVAAPAPPAQQ